MIKDFRELSIEDLSEIINSFDNCLGYLDHIDALLKIYSNASTKKEKENINFGFPINKLEMEKAYYMFLKMIGAEYTTDNKDEINNKPDGYVPFGRLLPELKWNNRAVLPWKSFQFNKNLYIKETEEIYLELGEMSKLPNIHKAGNVEIQSYLEFDSLHEIVIGAMKEYPRSNEVLTLYEQYLIAKSLNKEPKLISNSLNHEKSIDIEKLFFSHYENIKSNIKKNDLLPKKILVSDQKWQDLLNKANIFLDKVVQIEIDNKTTLESIRKVKKQESEVSKLKDITVEFKEKNVIEVLMEDLHQFFKKNKIKTTINGAYVFPKIRAIKPFSQGPTLIGRIATGDGKDIRGVAAISREYKNYLDKIENPDLYVPTRSDESVKKQLSSKVLDLLDLIKKNRDKDDIDGLLKRINDLFPDEFFEKIGKNLPDMELEVVDLDKV